VLLKSLVPKPIPVKSPAPIKGELDETAAGSRGGSGETATAAYRAVSAFQGHAREPEAESTDQFA
jgi:hypothetical protein